MEGLNTFLHCTGRKKSNPGQGGTLAHNFKPWWTPLVLPIHGFPHRISLMLVSTGCGWESFLSPQDQTNPSIATGPMVMRVCHQGFRGRGCKTYSPGLALHRRAFITSCYTLSQQPARVIPALLRPRGVSVFAPQTHLFGTFLLLYSFSWGFVLSRDASVCCHWGSVTECFSPAQTSGWWRHF